MNVTVDADGRVVETEVVRGSGSKVLDRRAVAIVAAAAPYGRFNAAMRKQADQLVDHLALPLHARREPRDHAEHAVMTGAPSRYAVAGNPVAHSQSPFIHAEFARADRRGDRATTGCSARSTRFAATVRAFAAGGGRGCNVTMPFKFEAFALAARAHAARRAGRQPATACASTPAAGLGDNTDGAGLVRDIERNAGVALRGARVLLIGAGGGAAGVLGPLLAAGPAELVVANRDREPRRRAGRRGTRTAAARDAARCCAPRRSTTAAAASTSSSTPAPAASPAPPCRSTARRARARRAGARHDVRRRRPSAFLAWARGHGATGRDGLGMLVEQAAEAFLLLARRAAPTPREVLAALRAAARRADERSPRPPASAASSRLLLLAFVALQLWFLLRIALMAVVDPQSTTFQRSEAWRLAPCRTAAWPGSSTGSTSEAISTQPQARRDRLRGRRLHRAQRRRVGRAREGLGEERPRRGRRRAGERARRTPGRGAQARAGRRRRARPRSSAARRSPSSWRRTCSSAASAACCARRQELVLTWELEALLGKQRILEIYLNSVEWGEGVFGAEAAARRYFRVGAAALSAGAGGAAGGACCRRRSGSRSAPARPMSAAAPRRSRRAWARRRPEAAALTASRCLESADDRQPERGDRRRRGPADRRGRPGVRRGQAARGARPRRRPAARRAAGQRRDRGRSPRLHKRCSTPTRSRPSWRRCARIAAAWMERLAAFRPHSDRRRLARHGDAAERHPHRALLRRLEGGRAGADRPARRLRRFARRRARAAARSTS